MKTILLAALVAIALIATGSATIEDAQRNLDRLQSESSARMSGIAEPSFESIPSNLNTIEASISDNTVLPSLGDLISRINTNLGLLSRTSSAPANWPSSVPYHQELIDMLK